MATIKRSYIAAVSFTWAVQIDSLHLLRPSHFVFWKRREGSDSRWNWNGRKWLASPLSYSIFIKPPLFS